MSAELPPGTEPDPYLDQDDTTIDDLSPEERDELERVLQAGFDDVAAGRVVEGDEIVRRLLARNRS